MPIIYLSPSTQEGNFYVTGGSEEYHMNRVADAMLPYLDASGIRYVRNTPKMTAASSIAASNAGSYELHLAIHSNAAPEDRYGSVRGSIVFYYPGSVNGRRAADLIAENLRAVYPLPDKVSVRTTTAIGELRRVRAPSVFLELAYHDNPEDAAWITENVDQIARSIVLALTEYFGIPFLAPAPARDGVVDVGWGRLNVRARPDLEAPVIAQAYDGAALTVLNEWQGWYLVRYNGRIGYASARYIDLV